MPKPVISVIIRLNGSSYSEVMLYVSFADELM